MFEQHHASGNTTYAWVPSKKLRLLGWTRHALGSDPVAATREALRLNEEVDKTVAPSRSLRVHRRLTMGELITRFEASAAFEGIADNTARGYRTRGKEIRTWTLDGRIVLTELSPAMLERFVEDSLATTSPSVTASRLGYLRLLLNWGRRKAALDPVTKAHLLELVGQIDVPTVERRKVALDWPATETVARQADADGCPVTGPGLRFAFWTMQRQGDLLAITRFALREIVDVDPRDRTILTCSNGKVMGFWLGDGQAKTGEPVVCPLPPFLFEEATARFGRSHLLFPDMDHPERAITGDRFRKLVNPRLPTVTIRGREIRVIHKDMRRSGMTHMRRHSAAIADIRAISGHANPQRERMDEVYMPHDPLAACRAMARCLRTMAEIEQRDAEASD